MKWGCFHRCLRCFDRRKKVDGLTKSFCSILSLLWDYPFLFLKSFFHLNFQPSTLSFSPSSINIWSIYVESDYFILFFFFFLIIVAFPFHLLWKIFSSLIMTEFSFLFLGNTLFLSLHPILFEEHNLFLQGLICRDLKGIWVYVQAITSYSNILIIVLAPNQIWTLFNDFIEYIFFILIVVCYMRSLKKIIYRCTNNSSFYCDKYSFFFERNSLQYIYMRWLN